MRSLRYINFFLFQKTTTFKNSNLLRAVSPLTESLRFLSATRLPKKAIEFQWLTPSHVANIVEKYSNSESPPWKDIIEEILAENLKHSQKDIRQEINGLILKSCLKQHFVDSGMSYVKYVLDKGGSLSMMDYFFVLELLSRNVNEVTKYEDLVELIFKNFKSNISCLPIIQKPALKVFSCLKSCYNELLTMCNESFLGGTSYVVSAAFNFNDTSSGWSLLNKYSDAYEIEAAKAYLLYCLRMAEEHKFSTELITQYTQFLQKNYCTIWTDLIPQLKTLTSVLNNDPNHRYKWSVNTTKINSKGNCLNCKLKLKNVEIKDEEYLELKQHVKRYLMQNKNYNVTTSDKDIHNFMSFLNRCSDYDIVIDGLNVLLGDDKGGKCWENLATIFKDKKKLFIARKHLTFKPSLYNYFKREGQMFLANNISNDDIYIIYAAMHGGKNTHFISNDFFRGYANYFPTDRLKRLFIKWKISHNYTFNNYRFRQPFYHANVSQETLSPEDEQCNGNYCWHLSFNDTGAVSINTASELQWICLRAFAKKKIM